MENLTSLIDFLFEYATYALLCLLVGLMVGYILAGPYVIDLILSLVF
jgi:hypothetical protein